MPSYARKNIIRSDEVASYHLINRCVRRAFLCGDDESTGKNFDHRKKWVEDRIAYVVGNCFFVELLSYAVMSNHLHITLTTRVDSAKSATDEDIVQRWWNLFPRSIGGEYPCSPPEELKNTWLADADWLKERRLRLCSISWFMAAITEKIARRANKEDDVTGRFWEGRFESIVLLTDIAVLNACTYVDLNPIRAGIADSLEECENTSIKKRIEDWKCQSSNTVSLLLDFSKHQMASHLSIKDKKIELESYIQICSWKAACHLSSNPEESRELYLKSIRELGIEQEDLNWGEMTSARFAVGTREQLMEFAVLRGSRRHNFRRSTQ